MAPEALSPPDGGHQRDAPAERTVPAVPAPFPAGGLEPPVRNRLL